LTVHARDLIGLRINSVYFPALRISLEVDRPSTNGINTTRPPHRSI